MTRPGTEVGPYLEARPMVVANWKMNLDSHGATALARMVAEDSACAGSVQVLLAPSFPYLEKVAACLRSSPVGLAAQDLHWKDSGPFTGAVSGAMLVDVGATHVLVGHSERRRLFGEDDQDVRQKMRAAHAAGLVPLLCVGEDKEERDAGRAVEVVSAQICSALEDGFQQSVPVVAYEPVWAIGTTRAAEPKQVADMHGEIRRLLKGGIQILYGGSVTPENTSALMSDPEVDGLLVGTASLHAKPFLAIVRAVVGVSS